MTSGAAFDRARSPDETWALIAPELAGFGITRLARLTGLDRIGVPVWSAIAPNARSIAVNQGKGLTDGQARISAAMEAIERALAAQPERPVVTGPAEGFAPTDQRFDLLPELIAGGQLPLTVDEPVEWLVGEDLIRGDAIMLPADALRLDRTRADLRFWQSSDGLAAGNTVDEARLSAILERVERDAETLWYLRSPARRMDTRFDPAHFGDRVLDDLLERIGNASLTAAFFDMTSDVGIPCILCFVAPQSIDTRKGFSMVDVTAGSSADPSPVRAAIQAALEAVQSRMTYISGARDDIDPAIFTKPLPELTRLLMLAPTRAFPEFPKVDASGRSMLQTIITRLEVVGCNRVYAVSLASAGRFFAVEKLVVPELENPEGQRRQPFGRRAIRQALMP